MIRFNRVKQLLQEISQKRLLVIGDLMLDEYVWGRVSRISPEAPVPVVEVLRESYYPGGAANVARNVREFTSQVEIMGLVGSDGPGEKLRTLLAECGIGLGGLLARQSFATIVKTRIIARQQQVVRVDRELASPIGRELQDESVSYLRNAIYQVDGVILEDYGKGFLQQALVERLTTIVRGAGKVITADPNPRNPIQWRPMTSVKPNRQEAFAAAGEPWSEPGSHPLRDAALLRVGEKLLSQWQPESLLVTLGELGMILFQPGQQPHHVPPRAREVYDLSGAGDTAIALFTLALTAGATPIEAAEVANRASGIVVAKLGTATATPEELLESFSDE
jgi:D-glycero-beta-D-manno-heptose-7-phosphate kinase